VEPQALAEPHVVRVRADLGRACCEIQEGLHESGTYVNDPNVRLRFLRCFDEEREEGLGELEGAEVAFGAHQ
jgi:hypothetical protein